MFWGVGELDGQWRCLSVEESCWSWVEGVEVAWCLWSAGRLVGEDSRGGGGSSSRSVVTRFKSVISCDEGVGARSAL